MANISPTEMQKVQRYISVLENKNTKMSNMWAKAKATAEVKAGEVIDGIEIVGAPTVFGFLRGRMANDGKPFNIPGTQIDIELAAGLALAGAGLMDALGEYDQHALMCGFGLLAHYCGQVGTQYGKTGEFSGKIVAGEYVGALPSQMSAII